MKIFVTGASGFIGSRLCQRLIEADHDVIALSRSKMDAAPSQSQWVQGDLSSPHELARWMAGCDACFHLAALAKSWSKRPSDFHSINVVGTQNVFRAAQQANLKRVVFTSTASVFGPSQKPINESHPRCDQLDSEYERTKRECENVVAEFQSEGLDITTVYPSRVYGPGVLSQSNSLTRIFQQYLNGTWKFIPGDGTSVGNYVYIDDVVEGHLLAMFQSQPNEPYLLGGENLSFNQIVEMLARQSETRQKLWKIPKPILAIYATWEIAKARLTGIEPKFTPAFVNKYIKDWYLDSAKATRQLGYAPIGMEEGIARTIQWLRNRET